MPTRPNYHRPDKVPRSREDYGPRWWSVRRRKLRKTPWCEDCGKPAVDVDHIDNNRGNLSEGNLRSLCKSCHSRKTVARDGGFGRGPCRLK